jgi:N6-L-threonylcarbamoyladenine synthase
MIVLGIESTCDETACAVVEDGKKILSNVIASQTDLHAQYGGVFPELACRRHFDVMIPTIEQALQKAELSPSDIDLISVAHGPGLIGALLLGLNTAKSLSLAWNKPFVGVNHVEAHLYAALMGCEKPKFPALGVVVSGGHTFLVRMHAIGHYEMIGQTVDDAIGEAFDKVGVMLGLSYPGGPEIEKMARHGDPKRFPFKAGVVKGKPWNFSFSGLKTNVLYTVKGQDCDKKAPDQISRQDKPHIAASFQEAALKDIATKALAAAIEFECEMIFLGGGVTHNQRLRELFQESKIPVYWPVTGLSLDNAAMIAGLGYHLFLQKNCQGDTLDLEPLPRIPLSK